MAEIDKIENPPEEVEEEVQETKIHGNLNSSVELKTGDLGYVCYLLSDGGAMKEGTATKPEFDQDQWPPKKLVRSNEFDFWRQFESQFTSDERMVNVNDAKTIVKIFNNLDDEQLEKAIQFELIKADSPAAMRRIKDHFKKEFSILRLNGSNQYIKKGDILHCPNLDKEEANIFPTNVIDSI